MITLWGPPSAGKQIFAAPNDQVGPFYLDFRTTERICVNPQFWPSLKDWKGLAAALPTRRAIYGKVHRAPTDYRWFAWSSGFGAAGPSPLEHDLALGIEDEGSTLYCWRYSPSGAVAVKCYPSRAFDAAGRPGVVERQVLVVDIKNGLPPAALAFFLLSKVTSLDDTIWWNTWRDPRWKSLDYHLPIPDAECPAIRTDDLESLLDQGVNELLKAASKESLVQFYSQLLAGNGLAMLHTREPALTPLALAALLLPLDRTASERVSLAGGVLSTKLDSSRLAHWSGVACPPDAPMNETAAVSERHRSTAEDFVSQLERSVTKGMAPPTPSDLSNGGKFLVSFIDSTEPWFAPGTIGKQGLPLVGPWPVVQRSDEAIYLRQKVKSFIADVQSRPMSPDRRQLAIKANLLRALLLVLCPGSESLKVAAMPAPFVVPDLLFAGRIEVQDWQAMSQYTPAEFQRLVDQSLAGFPLLAMEVTGWLEACANSLDTGQTQQYARTALNSTVPAYKRSI